ncbi:pilus assembly protein N-terminal domain-containing protein [Enterovirga sp.]|jgi:Flp pilus assembly secretin CpaC|uniref:pilus assembly protein N-terminal domain-containing protein n=1 Tax=Enterovirga sp. TaxID=2026350 RepID=UPI0026225F15|nr:pilus assembly protein N-terminal domain-containing protein [Enterovirga sp.]MDB5589512.1 pilus assembly protein [Enterovirga sp.]
MSEQAWFEAAPAAVALALLVASGPAAARDAVRQVPAAAAADETRPAPAPAPRSRIGDRGEIQVTVDRAKVIRLPERTQTVVVGNPAIADMSIQKNGIVVLTGKSYGTTNLIALDSGGNMLAESTVSVGAPSEAVVVVQRGLERQSYSCTPNCQPSVILGDANGFFNENRGQADARNQFATSR